MDMQLLFLIQKVIFPFTVELAPCGKIIDVETQHGYHNIFSHKVIISFYNDFIKFKLKEINYCFNENHF